MPECAKAYPYSKLEFQKFSGEDPNIPRFLGREGRNAVLGEGKRLKRGEGKGGIRHSLKQQVYLLTQIDRATLLHVKSTILHCSPSMYNYQATSVD